MVGYKKLVGAGTVAQYLESGMLLLEPLSLVPSAMSGSSPLQETFTPSFGLFMPLHTWDVHSRQARINKNQSLKKILLKLSMFYDPTSPFVRVYAK